MQIATLVLVLTFGILLFLAFGHGMRPDRVSGDHGAGHAAAALCLVLFVVLGPATRVLARLLRSTAMLAPAPACAGWAPARSSVAGVAATRARASPAWLQRFRR